MLQKINQNRKQTKKKKEEKKKLLQEDIDYINDYKQQMEKLKEEEIKEKQMKKLKEKNLAEYQKLQYEEKKRLAMDNFKQFNEDSYKNLRRLEIEDDDFIKYAEYWIQEYKQQGKNITPLLLELKRYKKNYSLK